MDESFAPGWPGSPARWTSSAKSGVGTALGGTPVWFTLSHGILNEIYAPRIDEAVTRDLGFIVTGHDGYFSEVKRHAEHVTESPLPGVPCQVMTSRCPARRYELRVEAVTDRSRLAVVARLRFAARVGRTEDYRLYALLAPHLVNQGAGNTAWVGEYKGNAGLFAAREGRSLCLMSSTGFGARSAGFVGTSDGWQDLVANGELAWGYTRAENGNVALCGELPLAGGEVLIALGIGRGAEEAAIEARGALAEGFESIRSAYVQSWQEWQATLVPQPGFPLAAQSAAVVKTHESKQIPGAIVASLAVPWGFSKGDGDLGGYHLVWPRDMVQSAGALLATGAMKEARAALIYLAATQEADGHWPQNMWIEGNPYWNGVQMDETALPILLLDLVFRENGLQASDATEKRFWPMVRRAAGFIVRNGPVTQQDRWEEDGGYTPYTLGAEIAALLVAAEWAERSGERELAPFLRDTADSWCAQIDHWIYVADTSLARKVGVAGYYVRVTAADRDDGNAYVAIRNRAGADSRRLAEDVVCTDALALVRFGLRAADDPRILDTIRVIDATLQVRTPAGPCWYRYNGDGYGEHEDGAPFDGTGIGRLWPLLTGERAHHALAAGDRGAAEDLRRALEAMAGDAGLLPEQLWDGPDLPQRELFFGRPAGSAMPLVWAHAEYLKLIRSLRDGRVFDLPPQTVQRYIVDKVDSPLRAWRFNQKIAVLAAGCVLRIVTLAPASIRWSADGWHQALDTPTVASGLGVHYADLPTRTLPAGADVRFTFYWPEAGRWEGTDFRVAIVTPVSASIDPLVYPSPSA